LNTAEHSPYKELSDEEGGITDPEDNSLFGPKKIASPRKADMASPTASILKSQKSIPKLSPEEKRKQTRLKNRL
jgi:hypothetical protein